MNIIYKKASVLPWSHFWDVPPHCDSSSSEAAHPHCCSSRAVSPGHSRRSSSPRGGARAEIHLSFSLLENITRQVSGFSVRDSSLMMAMGGCTVLLTRGVRKGVLRGSRESRSGERGWEKAKPPIFGG